MSTATQLGPGPSRPSGGSTGMAHHDGRAVRSRRTRDAVLTAFLALIDEGDLSPTAQRVAERAQVALRTVFSHFADLDTLHLLAGERLFARLAEVPTTFDPTSDLAARTAAFIAYRVAVFEVLHPMACAARMREPVSSALRHNRDALLALAAAAVREVFAPEIAELPPGRGDRLVHVLCLVTNWAAWHAAREDLGLAPDEAAATLEHALQMVLAGRHILR